jgi:iron only hydrogenase large subunit-like protein
MNIAALLAAVAARKAAGDCVVLSTTSQTITALSVSLDLPQLDVLAKLKTFFHSVGVDYVLDVSFARQVTNAETAREFMQRVALGDGAATSMNGLLSSTCPGWICYVEKSQPCALPYLSRVRSPQQIQGVIVKTVVARALGIPSSRVFHCTLMPCFDKKLEAMRLQFAPENIPDVDMVPAAPPSDSSRRKR